MELSVCFFYERTPELVFTAAVHEEQFTISGWQTIVDNDINPAIRFPDAEVESS